MKRLFIFLKGLLMGSADIIPGVSGGTIALITGIYTRLVDAIDSVVELFKERVKSFRLKGLWDDTSRLDWELFIPLFLGIGIAFFSLAHAIGYLLDEKAALTYSFFFGLIAGSAVFLCRQLDTKKWNIVTFFLLGSAAGFFVAGLKALTANHTLPILFVSGGIAITAMILPGISGSFMLVLLNQYDYFIDLIRNLHIRELLVFGTGAVLSLGIFTKLLHYLIHEHKDSTFAFLIGLMLGSLRRPAQEIGAHATASQEIPIILLIVGGFVIVFLFEKLGEGIDPHK